MTAISNLLPILLALCIPAMIAWWVPQTWRIAALILWILGPLAVMLVMVGIEAAGSATPDDLARLLQGFAMMGSVLALPWLLACLAGFAVASLLRDRRRAAVWPTAVAPSAASTVAEAAAPPTAAKTAAPPTVAEAAVTPASPRARHDAVMPSLLPPSGWQPAHLGSAHDGLRLDGLDVWALPWRPEASPAVMLPHLAHPGQMHDFAIYTIDDGHTATRFAAQELSNGVWGFYRWLVAADAAEGRSADGSLRYTHSLGDVAHGRYDAVAPTATLHDARTGALLFDGGAWCSSRVVPQADGDLLLDLEQNRRQTLFRIDPRRGSFHDLTRPGTKRPLAELPQAAAEALRESLDKANTYTARRIAPDGSVMVDLEANEWFNGGWVHGPCVTDLRTGRRLLDLRGTDWDATVTFPRGQALRLGLTSHRHGEACALEMDLATGRYTIEGRAEDGLIAELPARFDAANLKAYGNPERFLPPRRPRATPRSYGIAFLILVAALLAIAGATYATMRVAPDHRPQKLDRVPAMPRP